MAKSLFEELPIKEKDTEASSSLFDLLPLDDQPSFRETPSVFSENAEAVKNKPRELPPFQQFGVDVASKAVQMPGIQLGMGALQGIGDVGASVLNAPLALAGTEARVPHPDLGQVIPSDMLSQSMFMAGQLGGGFKGGQKAYNAIDKLRKGEKTTVAGAAGRGALAGYLTGERGEGGGIFDPGRVLGGILGGTIGGGAQLTYPKIAERIVQAGKEARGTASKMYDSVLSKAITLKAPKLEKLRVSPKNTKLLKKIDGADYNSALRSYAQSPSVNNAHRLQSDLGKYIAKNTNNYSGGKLTDAQRQAYDIAMKLQEKLQKGIAKSLKEVGGEDLVSEYASASDFYRDNVVPYFNPMIRQYTKRPQERTAKDLVKGVANSVKGRAQLTDLHPDIQARMFLNKTGGGLLNKALPAYGIYKGADIIGGLLNE